MMQMKDLKKLSLLMLGSLVISACQNHQTFLPAPQIQKNVSRINTFNTQPNFKFANIKDFKISMGYPGSRASIRVKFDAVYAEKTYNRDVVFEYDLTSKELSSFRDYGVSHDGDRQRLANELKKLMKLKIKL